MKDYTALSGARVPGDAHDRLLGMYRQRGWCFLRAGAFEGVF